MALQLPHSQFFHIPHTGGLWVRKAIHRSGIYTNELCQVDSQFFFDNPKSFLIKRGTIIHITPYEINKFDNKRFTIVRHPLNWLKSYFNFKHRYNWHPERHEIDKCESDSYEEFIKLYLKICPGYYSKMVSRYDRVDIVGRTENMAPDLVDILKRCGEKFDEKKILETPPYNTTKRVVETPELPIELKEKILKAEEYVIKRYYIDGLI